MSNATSTPSFVWECFVCKYVLKCPFLCYYFSGNCPPRPLYEGCLYGNPGSKIVLGQWESRTCQQLRPMRDVQHPVKTCRRTPTQIHTLSQIRIFCKLFFISDKWRKRGWSVRHFFLTEKENKFRSEILFTLLNFATDFHQTILYFDYYYHFFLFCKLKLYVCLYFSNFVVIEFRPPSPIYGVTYATNLADLFF